MIGFILFGEVVIGMGVIVMVIGFVGVIVLLGVIGKDMNWCVSFISFVMLLGFFVGVLFGILVMIYCVVSLMVEVFDFFKCVFIILVVVMLM